MMITSLQNGKVKRIVKLRSRSQREKEGVLLVEGVRAVARALAAGWPIEELYFCPALLNGVDADKTVADCRNSGIALLECSEAVFCKMAYRTRPEGILAVARRIGQGLSELDSGRNPLFLVAEAVEKPGNLGSMLRIADACGANAVIVCEGGTDINNPNVVRASVGTIFSVPVVEASSAETIEWLRARSVQILAAKPNAERVYTAADLSGPLAVVVGAERPGLSETWCNAADLQVRIPMLGRGDSLNVSTSAAVLLYEAVRQRGGRCEV